jgi:hypothetical protein
MSLSDLPKLLRTSVKPVHKILTWYSEKMMISYICIRGFMPNSHKNLEWYLIRWYAAASSWLKVAPFGIRRLMNWLKSNYGSIPIYITENGFSDYLGNTDDAQRIYYLKHYINQLLKGNLITLKFGHSEKHTKFEKIFHLKIDATE